MAKAATITMTEKTKYLNDLKKELNNYTTKLSRIQKEFKNNTEGNVDQITQSLQEILKEAGTAYGKLESASAEQWEPIKAITAAAFSNLRSTFQEKLKDSGIQMKEFAEKIGENCQVQLEHVEDYVKEHPLKSILIALGAGLIIGKILR